MEEIYLLTKHANFSSQYIENIPVYKRRFYLFKLKEELEAQKEAQEKAAKQSRNSVRPVRARR